MALLSACEATGSGPAEESATATPKVRREAGLDVLLITIDTLRADALGSYGNARADTPWLDRLAERGVRFTDARAHNVVTLPSHASILSGLHPFEHGVRDNAGFRFPTEPETLATLLGAAGYRTGAFVSAFPLAARFGLDRGFDVYEDSFVDAAPRTAFLEQERDGRETVDLAVRWLQEAEGDPPSFAWIHLYEPHYPYLPPEPFDQRFADSPYDGDVAAADHALEPLLAPLLDAGAEGNTLVVVTSDHGEALGDHGEATHGIFAYDSTLAVPLIVYQPRLLVPQVVDAPVGLIDVLPTILDLLGQPAHTDVAGVSLAGLAAGQEGPPSPTVYFESLSGQINRGWAPLFGVVQDDWKYIDLPIPELYDLRSDPEETQNLAPTQTDRRTELEAVLAVLRSADPGAQPAPVDDDTAARLQSLGYLAGGKASSSLRADSYGEADDPKRLIGLDAMLRETVSLHAAGDLEAALERGRELVRRRPDMRTALMTVAQIEHDLGRLEAAASSMRHAHELFPQDTTALALAVSYLTQAGRAADAAALSARHAASARPDVEVLLLRSLALARSGRNDEAVTMIERSRELEPDNPMVDVYAGTHELLAGRPVEARAAFERALELDPATVRAHTALAVLDAEQGRFADALGHWKRAVTRDPRQLDRLLAMSLRLWTSGMRGEALPFLELFRESAPIERYRSEIERVGAMLASESGRSQAQPDDGVESE